MTAPAPTGPGTAPVLDPADPRPRLVVEDGTVLLDGGRCDACGYPTTAVLPRCPECGGTSVPARFGPGGTVFSATVLRVGVPGRTPPYGLAYVDVDGGPRILAHVDGDHERALPPSSRAVLCGWSEAGDPMVRAEEAAR